MNKIVFHSYIFIAIVYTNMISYHDYYLNLLKYYFIITYIYIYDYTTMNIESKVIFFAALFAFSKNPGTPPFPSATYQHTSDDG